MEPPKEPQPGPSHADTTGARGETTRSDPTGIPVLDTMSALGPVGATYDEEFLKLKRHLKRNADVLGPAAPVVFVNHVRNLYERASAIAADESLSPYDKCVCLFHLFDAIVLAYKNLSFVRCDGGGARSVYGYSELVLKSILSRVEAIARRVALAVHDAYSLTVLNEVVASAEQRLSQVRTEKDMSNFFRDLSGTTTTDGSAATRHGGTLPLGIERYQDPYPEADALLRRLYASCGSHSDYVREFHDAVFLMATANATATTLSGALETRLTDKDRNVVWLEVPGDRLFASSLCASAIAFLRKSLDANADRRTTTIETYRINYGRVFGKYRGESERNFDALMEWIKTSVRGGGDEKFRVFWFPDIENLMSPRTSNDQEHIATIKNSMLQHMDAFNKDRTLRSFLLLFNSSEGPLDSAFARRLETVVSAPPDPLTDLSVATQAVGAELARYHVNLSDDLVARVAAEAGSATPSENGSSERVGGFAHVQASLRDLYIDQKLTLRYDAGMVDVKKLAATTLHTLMGRYISVGVGVGGSGGGGGNPSPSRETLYDLDERPIHFDAVGAVAFCPGSRLDIMFSQVGVTQIKYNSNTPGDPKTIDERIAARTVFLHDIGPSY